MVNPVEALSFAILLIIISALVFWPEKGIIWQFKIGRKNNERIIREDTLKQLFDHEYRNKPATLRSISGALGFSMDKTASIMQKLIQFGLAGFIENHYVLTTEGRSYALRVIRLHRLWERYFADETGLKETEWHKHAEKREHNTTAAQADELAQAMGNPMFDPHGDPIPTLAGEVPPRKSMTINNLEPGDVARITHIEDEPAVLYAQLAAEGLYPGMQLHMLEKTDQRIRFFTEGEEIILAPVLASHINVQPILRELSEEDSSHSLSDLEIGESGEVVAISKACRGIQRRRLMDLGIIPGTTISAELKTSSGNPTAYLIRGALIALRDDQAKFVKIKRSEN